MNDAPATPPPVPPASETEQCSRRDRVLRMIVLGLLALGSAFFLKSAYQDLRYDPRNQNLELLRNALFPKTP